ncbi:hypothetical protein pb186bvf_006215 [Paramecium bursaria]
MDQEQQEQEQQEVQQQEEVQNQPTLNQKQFKIVKYVIANTPFGQANLVIKDLCKLINGLNPDDPQVLSELKEHNEEHLAVVKGQGLKVVISTLNSNEDFYVDQKNSKTLKVNHEQLTIVSVDDVELPKDPQLDALRDELDKQLDLYLKNNFNEQLSGFYVLYQGDASDFTIYVGITAKNLQLNNYYVGDWISKWEITNKDIKGKYQIQAHYYEEGNIQLLNKHDVVKPIQLKLQDPKKEAQSIVEIIDALETEHLKGLEQIYGQFNNIFFKAMRRQLPVTQSKIDWSTNVAKLVGNLKL